MNHTAKIIGVGFVTALTIASTNLGQISGNEARQVLSNKSLIEHTYVDGYSDGNSFLEQAILENDPSKIQIIKLNCTFKTPVEPTPLTKLNDKRASFYNQKYFPKIISDGIYKELRGEDDDWTKQIKEAIAKQQQLVEFAVTPTDKNNIILETKGLLPEINNHKKLNLGIMIYHDWKPVDITDDSKTVITTQRYLIQCYPLGALGSPQAIEYNKTNKQSITFSNISDKDRNMMGAIFFVQDMNTKQILSAAQYCFAKEENPAYFNWNNWPKNLCDEKWWVKKEYYQTTGLGEMKFSITNAKDLKYLSFEIAENIIDNEKNIYEILTAKLGKNINVDKFEFDKEKRKISISFKNPLNGDFELFSHITKFNKINIEHSASYKVKNFIALNSKNESIFYDINDIKQYHAVKLVVTAHPSDFNGDAKINETDLLLLSKKYGTRLGDKDYHKRYDICNIGTSKDRIDIFDLIKQKREIIKQVKLQKEVDNANKLQEFFRGEI